ncbi:MAG: alpha/beta hydrolase family protein [Acetobacteraceae bacterium]
MASRQAARRRIGWALLLLLALWPFAGRAAETAPVGLRRIEFFDAQQGGRTLAVTMFYPAALPSPAPKPIPTPFYTGLTLYLDAPIAPGAQKRPLVMFSHGRGSNGMVYAWFAQTLASHGFIVAALNHYHANTYDARIAYLANKLWQRPLDISLVITDLLHDPSWGALIDPGRIGVAGHSQGGFTSLWVAGARVNAEKFTAFQRRWRNNPDVPAHLRRKLPVDATPALHVHDPRIRAAFAMAPGVIQAFGMDPDGLRHLAVPTYLIVGASDTQAPPAENAEFAAKYIPHVTLTVIPGPVGHEIFVNECDAEGRDEFPESCIDAAGVDRAKLHAMIGEAALAFFGQNLR